MPQVHKKAYSQYSDEQLFAVVNDVEHYPTFIEWCHRVEVFEKSDTLTKACLHLQKGLLKHSFTTENSLVYPHSMSMRLVSGPFKQFSGEWRFTPQKSHQDGVKCEIEFKLNYEFSSKLVAITVGQIFFHIADDMVKIFLQRAKQLYG